MRHKPNSKAILQFLLKMAMGKGFKSRDVLCGCICDFSPLCVFNHEFAGGKCQRGRMHQRRNVLRAQVQLLHGGDVLLYHTHSERIMIVVMVMVMIMANGDGVGDGVDVDVDGGDGESDDE